MLNPSIYPELSPHNGVAVTVYTNGAGPLGKRFELMPDGTVTKGNRAELTHGRAQRFVVNSLKEFANLRASLSSQQALGFGVCDHEFAKLVSKRAAARHPQLAAADGVALVTRTTTHFRWSAGPGVLMLDHDPLPGCPAMGPEELHNALCSAFPLLRNVHMLWVPSAGSCIVATATGEEHVPLRGSRIYMLVDQASVIPIAGKLILDRLVLDGRGVIKLAGNGLMLERTIFDGSVWRSNGFDFVRANCGAGLEQRSVNARYFGPADQMLRAADIEAHALTHNERQSLEQTWAKLRNQQQGAADRTRDEWHIARAREALHEGATDDEVREKANALARTTDAGRLDQSHKLQLQGGRTVTVAEVLADPDDFHGQRLHDPVEPEYDNGDDRIAVIWAAIDGSISIKSFAHGGATYLLKARNTAEEDLAGVEDDPEPEQPSASDDVPKKVATLRVWRPAELDGLPPPRWLVKGWLPERGVAGLVGDTNIGKTFAALDLGVSISQGWDWLGVPVQQGAVVYVAAEGSFGMRARLKAVAKHRNVSLGQLSAFGLIGEGLDLRSKPHDADRLIEQVRQFAKDEGQPVKLIVLDTLNRMMAGGDENSSTDMGSLIASATRVAEATGALVLLIHHTGKDASKGARGHSSLKANLDTLIIVERKTDQIEMRLDKQRDGSTDLRLAYRLQSVNLGVAGDNDALESVTSAVVVPADPVVARAQLKLGEWRGYALDAWIDADGLLHPPNRQEIWEQAQRVLTARGKSGDNLRKQLNKALAELVELGVLEEDAGGGYRAGPDYESVRALLH